MPVRIEPGSEPIPGYRLIERLGGGGFGEVWKAEAPGGLLKAMKFVYGELGTSSAMGEDESSRAEQELKALSRVKTVRHSYILSLERYDIIDNQLIITTELADRTLWDRFRECRSQGLPGIPREELLGFMSETAEALDTMFEEHQLQHLDIKPQNLFLVYKHVKVADFGLVKDLGERGAATITGGVTPVYAAPETFDGWLSRFSDQYSLAIVYQELLTGQRPFTGSSLRQLVLQHLQADPDLSSLPASDRPTVARALSKNPDERFPTCLEFVRSLRAMQKPASAFGFPKPQSAPGLHPRKPAPDAHEAPPDDDVAQTQATRRSKLLGEAPAVDEVKTEQPAPARPDALPAAARETPSSHPLSGITAPSVPALTDKDVGAALLQPAVVIGLGTLGMELVRRLRRVLSEEVALPDQLPLVRLLAIDSDADAVQRAGQGEPAESLRAETLLTRLQRPSTYLKPREGKPALDVWLNAKVLYRIPRNQNGAGARPLGRLAFVDSFKAIQRRLEADIAACSDPETIQAHIERSPLGLRNAVPRVYIVACLAGNTGSGMFVDVAYLARRLLRKRGVPQAEIVGLFLIPPAGEKSIRSVELANTYAAFKELTHYASGQGVFTARFEGPEPGRPAPVFQEAGPPFQRCHLLPLPERGQADAMQNVLTLGAQFLYREVAGSLGKAVDAERLSVLDPAQPLGAARFHSIGLSRISWPRRRLLDRAARALCRRLVERWMEKRTTHLPDGLAASVEQQWDGLGMRPEGLIARHQEACDEHLKQPAEKMMRGALGGIESLLKSVGTSAGDLNIGPVLQGMDALERVIGMPEECRTQGAAFEPGVIENALEEVSGKLADECDQRIATLIVRLIEEPAYRLAGAEEALRVLSAIVERALQAQEQLCKELQERAVRLFLRIHALLDNPAADTTRSPSSSLWRLGRKSTSKLGVAGEVLELLKSYPKCRYQSLILSHVNRLYVSLRGRLSDQIREVGFCRQRLGELSGLFYQAADNGSGTLTGAEKMLLPGGATRLDDAVKDCLGQVSSDDLLTLDQEVQELIRKEHRALLSVCMGHGRALHALAPAMVGRAENFLAARLAGQSVAEMLLQQAGDADAPACVEALLNAYERAAPALQAPGKTEIGLILIPPDSAGQKLDSLVRQNLPAAVRGQTQRRDEIVFYRETQNIAAADIEQFGPIAQEAYRQRLALDALSLHSREDVPEWTAETVAVG